MAMEALCSSLTLPTISFRLNNSHQLSPQITPLNAKTRFPTVLQNHLNFSLSNSSVSSSKAQVTASPSFVSSSSTTNNNNHWIVLMAKPPEGVNSKPQIIDYYVNTLKTVLGSEKDAQMCIYDASCDTHFGFCCNIDEQASLELARLPEVLSVKPDPDCNSNTKDYTSSNIGNLQLFPSGNTKHWLVRMDKPGIGVVTKAQMVDYYTQILTKVLGNEQDAQMCIYNVSWQSQFSFCCELDEECANELTGVPGVLSVELDRNFESENKDYGGNSLQSSTSPPETLEASETPPVRTKKLFITGLSFYTSEKTLRSHFEGFGELVEVKIIMDKISKRSKGYAFVEYTTEEAASAALKEMNGKIINGWMIVVDVAKTKPRNLSEGHPRPTVRPER